MIRKTCLKDRERKNHDLLVGSGLCFFCVMTEYETPDLAYLEGGGVGVCGGEGVGDGVGAAGQVPYQLFHHHYCPNL